MPGRVPEHYIIFMVLNNPLTLEQILASRDRRVEQQRRLIEAYPHGTLVVLTVVMPGSVKQSDTTRIIGQAGVGEIERLYEYKILYRDVRDLITGFEAYFVVSDTDADRVKENVSRIERTHPLGRLMDIDVILRDGTPLSRRKNGGGGRKCIVCDDDARVCMRLGRHPYEEILQKIERMVGEYVRRK